ncbi:hypothetical protein RND81_10G149400 [Saponaria officinalis]|uniref:Uncharacterized protein n=1 Tax=Saponaria officinalis TaxID=3572 RepID=A0AAW1I268_SAPOF
MLNFGSSKQANPESGNSYLSLLSGPPSLLQYDFPLQSSLKLSTIASGSYPDQPALRNVTGMGKWPLLHDNGNLNVRDAGEAHPVFPCRSPVSANDGNSGNICVDFDCRRVFVNRTDYRNDSGRSTLLLQSGLTCSPSSSRNGEFLALTNAAVLEASLQTSSSKFTKQPSFVSGCPRVFCMGACGDLLVSNTGLFGIFCSCHGMRMSILKFCEHSGLFNVNPGYAVHMESGECIAQWRKVYLQKFKITIPEDHKGWDWPEGILPISRLASNKTVTERRKVFDLSSLFTSSAESVMSTQPCENVSNSRALSNKECVTQVSKDVHQVYGRGQCTTQMSSTGISGRCLTGSEATWKENSQNISDSSYFNFNVHRSSENLLGSAIQTSQSIGSENHSILKVNTAVRRSSCPSSIELKLGQPSHPSLQSTSTSALIPHSSDVRAAASQEKLTKGNLKVTETSGQYSHHHSAYKWGNSKEQIRPGLPDNSASTANGEGIVFHKRINKVIIDSHPIIPSALRHQSDVKRSSPDDHIWCGHRPIRPSDTSNLASRKKKNRTAGATDGNNDVNFASGSSYKLYPKQMENFNFVTGNDSHPIVSRVTAKEICSVGMPSPLSGVSSASAYTGDKFSLQSYPDRNRFANGPKTLSIGSGAKPTLQTVSNSLTSLTKVLPPGYGTFFNKGVDATNPHMSVDRMRVLTLKHMKQFANENPENGPLGLLNQEPRTNTDRRQQSKNFTISDPGVSDCLLRGPLEGQGDRHCLHGGHNTPTFLSDIGHDKGTNSLEIVGASSRKTTADNQGCDPQPEQRGQNKSCNCTVLQRGFQGPITDKTTDVCNCTVQMTCANRECHPKVSVLTNAIQKQISTATIGTTKLSGTIFPDDSAPIETDKLVDCHQKGKEQMHCKLNSFSSQWRDVPPRTATGGKRRCLDAPTHLSGTRAESVALFKRFSANGIAKSNQVADPSKGEEFSTSSGCSIPAVTEAESVAPFNKLSAKGIARSNQVADLSKEKEVSISSGCSVPAITEASSEVNKIDSCTLSGGSAGYVNDQVVDQGSAIMRSCSSADTNDSVRSSQPVSNTELMCTETVSPIMAYHGQKDEFRQMNLKSNELSNLCVSGAILAEKQKPVPAGTDVDHLTRVSEGVQVLNGDSNGRNLKKRRSTLCQVKLLSRKRDPHCQRDFVGGEHNGRSSLNGSDESIDIPGGTTVKRLKMNNFDDALKKQVESTKDLKGIWLSRPNSDETERCNLKSSIKAKPVACGKYGIICDQELDIDQLKPPKIVPLSQVLKVAKRCTEFGKESEVLLGTKMKSFRFSEGNTWSDVSLKTQTVQGSQCDKVLACNDGDSDASIHEALQMQSRGDEISADDLSTPDEVGASGLKINPIMSLPPPSQSKTKETRMRNLYELSMRGNKFISADLSLSQNLLCAPPKRNASVDAGESDGAECRAYGARRSFERRHCHPLILGGDALCCVCGISNKDDFNCLLECGHCLIRIHQACYGISRAPKGEWLCRPCRTSSKDVVCVLCGYGGGAMTRAFGSRNVVKTLLKAWNIRTESHIVIIGSAEPFNAEGECRNVESSTTQSYPLKPVVHNCIIAGLFNSKVKQWIHMVCGLWTPGTRCPNVDTMSAFDVSGVYYPNTYVVCYICKRSGGSCIKCRVETCCAHFHPWCAHQKGLLQSEVEGVDSDKVGFYGRCLQHASYTSSILEDDIDVNTTVSDSGQDQQPTCARTEAYQGKNQEGRWPMSSHQRNGKDGCLVTQVQLDAWLYINRYKLNMRRKSCPPILDVEHDYRKEYAQFKAAKGWKRLVVYKSGIHALGLYTSQFIPRGAMVVEYIGEIVGQRVADKRETEYLAGGKLQYKSACYFFRIDKEQIIDATCKGGIARFVNHSCQPNCIAKVITIRSQKKVVFFAQKDICPGEEITYDYHFSHEDEGKKIPCFCNSKNCRRYLN